MSTTNIDVADREATDITADSEVRYAIQPAIWPQREISTEVHAHFTSSGPVGLSVERPGAKLGRGATLATNPYYNVFNLGKWRRNAGDLPLELELRGKGRFLISIRLASQGMSEHQLHNDEIELDGVLRLPIPADPDAHDQSVLYFKLIALEDGRLDDFAWTTTQPPRQTPDLMLSVTTFRREAAVENTVRRFREYRATTELRDHVRMLVVDNGNSVDVTEGDGVKVIPNENLGGAGGFTRGLIEAQRTGATHCLFMDDDASIQMEAITRTWWFLAYAIDPRTAVAGAVVDGLHRWRMGENGATFDLGCHALYGGTDLRDYHEVFDMEFETTQAAPDDFYGGWWFFAFPVSEVQHLPFPFFVRGDDVSFSLVNDFDIVTLPGVASMQESFVDKASPQTWYLDFRSHLVHHLSLPKKQRSWKQLQKMVASFYLRTVLRFHYESLSAVNLALEDVLAGPDFFDANADMAKRRADLKELTQAEAWKPVHGRPPGERVSKLGAGPLRKLIWLTGNGHFPAFGNVGSSLVLTAPHREDWRATCGAKRVTFLNADQSKYYVLERDQQRFWEESKRLLKNTLRLRKVYRQLGRQWRQGYENMTSDRYWDAKLHLDPAEVADAGR
jgi:galactofuranosylgalactofuranosylrhamnosyl-N-acetylglucosaminyl-diphospho-decaprenol beta-1,5/1,6-galactofuranosyltransferase